MSFNNPATSGNSLPDAKIALAFDIGLKRTGLAVGQTLTQTVQTAGQLIANNGQLDWNALDKKLEECNQTLSLSVIHRRMTLI